MNEEPCGPEKNDNTDWLNSDTPVSSNVNPSEIEDDEDSDDDSIEEAVEKESIFESVANGTKFTLSTQTNWEHEGRQSPYIVEWNTTSDVTKLPLPISLLSFLVAKYGDDEPIHLSTEYKRDEFTFRCHPNFQDSGKIYDWMRILFGSRLYPCRLAAVVILNREENIYELVVQSCKKKTGVQSVLLTEWEWDDAYHIVEPDNIDSPCFVVTLKPDSSKVLEVLSLDNWPDRFTNAFV